MTAPAAKPLWKKLLFPGFLVFLTILGIAGSRIAMRDPQTHVHSALDRFLWKKIDAPDFKLTDHNGQSFKLSQLRGKVVVFSFGFTNCPNICPATLSHFAAIRNALPESVRDKVQFLFISVDPDRDAPARLREYVPFFDSSFIGLTGTPAEVARVAYDYKATYKKEKPKGDDPSSYFVDHSADVYLIGPDGKWVLSYPFEELPKTEMIVRDIEKFVGGSSS